jgi:hypothetical protein
MAATDHPPGSLALLVQLQAYGVEPVRHGRFLGLKGRAVGQVPGAVWDALRRHRPQLLRHLQPEPTPFEARRARGLA